MLLYCSASSSTCVALSTKRFANFFRTFHMQHKTSCRMHPAISQTAGRTVNINICLPVILISLLLKGKTKWIWFKTTAKHSAYSQSGLGVTPCPLKCDFSGSPLSSKWFTHLPTKLWLTSVCWLPIRKSGGYLD